MTFIRGRVNVHAIHSPYPIFRAVRGVEDCWEEVFTRLRVPLREHADPLNESCLIRPFEFGAEVV